MARLLVLAGVLLWFLVGTPALANDSADCNQSSNPELTIRGCTKLLQIRGQTKQNIAFAFRNRGVAYYKKGDFDRAIADADRSIAVKPDLAEAFCDRGAAYRAKGDYDRAIADYGMAIRLKPDFAVAYNDVFQFVLLMGGNMVLAFLLLSHTGGITEAWRRIDAIRQALPKA